MSKTSLPWRMGSQTKAPPPQKDKPEAVRSLLPSVDRPLVLPQHPGSVSASLSLVPEGASYLHFFSLHS